jgi:hypothetical protein
MQRKKSEPCHIMLFYQWDNQKLVEKVYNYLTQEQELPVWMDVHGGMQHNALTGKMNVLLNVFCYINIDCNSSMSKGVQRCFVMICFLTAAYQESENCQRELSYALGTVHHSFHV